ncbi:hypothetical protein, partial [Streptomyces resistomycificus]
MNQHTQPTPLTAQQLDDIDTRAKAATPGPWTLSENYSDVLGPDGHQLASYWNPTSETRNGEFIAHAREDVRTLLAEVRRLRARVAELERPAVEAKRNEIRQSFAELVTQAREDRDYEGAFDVQCRLREHEEQWQREDTAAAAAAVS